MAKNLEITVFRAQVRRALADYIASEGCDCCRNEEAHKEAKGRLAKLLRVPGYSDSDDYDFPNFQTEKRK